MTKTIDIHSFVQRHADGAVVIDVREPGEYVSGHIPKARLVPMAFVSREIHSLPRDREVYVVCEAGNRSKAMASLLSGMGVDAVSVDGGLNAWTAKGKPVVTGPRAE